MIGHTLQGGNNVAETAQAITPESVLAFWFSEPHRKLWFRSTDAFDAEIRERFEDTVQRALDGQLDHWRTTAMGVLALVILLDQFPLNMYRNQPRSFSGEAAARAIADHALSRGLDAQMNDQERTFLLLPFMHSEDLRDQERAVALFEAAGLENNLRWARHHYDIVRRFGRFPHRNAVLGRDSTEEEIAWLASPDAFHG
jgi:uncharacterized protein (DUF924 family)